METPYEYNESVSLWRFTAPLTPESVIHCPECGEWSPQREWWVGEVPCERCGSHAALVCPKCDHHIDHVWQEPDEIEVR